MSILFAIIVISSIRLAQFHLSITVIMKASLFGYNDLSVHDGDREMEFDTPDCGDNSEHNGVDCVEISAKIMPDADFPERCFLTQYIFCFSHLFLH